MRSPALLTLIALALAPAACAAPPSAPPAAPAAAGASPFFPTPYTTEQLRDASKPGRTYVFRVEAPGKPTVLRVLEFTRVDAERAEVASTIKDEAGKTIESKPPSAATWAELQKHAEFPRDRTTTIEEKVEVPAGAWRCTVYTVRREGGEVDRFYFAKDIAGPPVLFFSEKDGKRLTTSTLIEYRAGR